eukprot:236768_1
MAEETDPSHTADINQISISPEDAATIKSQLFELCKQGDIDKNDEISFDEFSSVIKNFLPNSTDKRLHEMFSTFDDNNDGSISYVEFLSKDNFDKFLNYCGYITTTHQETESTPYVSDGAAILTRVFSVHDDHDKQIITAQQEVITKLNTWIADIGKTAEVRCKELETENDALRQELSIHSLELNTIKEELNTINEDKKSIQNEYEAAMNHKNILSEKLKDTKEALQQSENALEEYYELERKWKAIDTQNAQLKGENIALKMKVEDELLIIDNLTKEVTQMKAASCDKLQEIEAMNKGEDERKQTVIKIETELQFAREVINNQNAEIADLREKAVMSNASAGLREFATDRTLRFESTSDVTPDPPMQLMNRNMSMKSYDSEEDGQFGFHRLKSTTAGYGMTPGYGMTHAVTPGYGQLFTGLKQTSYQTINEYEAKEAEWRKVKEELKMENERLNEANERLTQQLIQMENEIKALEEEKRLVNDNEDDNAPLIARTNRESTFSTFCNIFKL